MENENGSENKPIDLFGNMSNNEREVLSKIGELIIKVIDKNKASDEKFQNALNEELEKIDSRYLQIYETGLEKGLHEGKKSGFWKGVVTGAGSIVAFIGLVYVAYLHSNNKNS